MMVKLSFLSLPGQNPLVLTISMQPLHFTFCTILSPVFYRKGKRWDKGAEAVSVQHH